MPDPSATPLSGNGAVLYQLGKVEGKLDAVLAGQTAQADVNAENKREHDEFRRDIADTRSDVAVIKAAGTEEGQRRRDSVQRWFAYLSIPTALIGSAASYIFGQINHP